LVSNIGLLEIYLYLKLEEIIMIYKKSKSILIFFIIFLVLVPNLIVHGAMVPKTNEELEGLSDLIVVGEVVDVYAFSMFWDLWSKLREIHLNIKIKKVEKGQFENDSIIVKCLKRRHEWDDQSHYLIPGKGAKVIAYLEPGFNGKVWDVILPNGILPDRGDMNAQEKIPLFNSNSQNTRYVLILPIELWILISILISLAIYIIKKKKRKFADAQ
jgi:hypothetical protein